MTSRRGSKRIVFSTKLLFSFEIVDLFLHFITILDRHPP
jgi:hypothetical protein